MPQAAKQIDMSFTGDDRLASTLLKGDFQYYLECDSPLSCQSFNASLTFIEDLGREIRPVKRLFGWMFTDRLLSENCHDPVLLAAALSESSGKPVIMGVSGRASSLERVKGVLADAKAKGLRNFLAVTGNLTDRQQSQEGGEDSFTDSVEILHSAQAFGKDLRLGAVVNPFKYTPQDQCLQYAKMLRKIHSGAQFLITQTGWDMKKAQELQWFLQKMNLTLLVIARVCLLSHEEALQLADGYQTGVIVPIPLGTLFQQDARNSAEEFQRRQLERAAWQIVGYRKLGFGAVQISGLQSAKTLNALFDQIDLLEEQCPDYDSWLELWDTQYGELNLAPTLNPHYLYRELLQKGKRDFDAEEYPVKGTPLPAPRLADRWRRALGKLLGDPSKTGAFWRVLRFLTRLPEEKLRLLQPCFYLDNSSCPKKLCWGPCGNSQSNGFCENGQRPCFFHRVLHLAAKNNDYQALETAYHGRKHSSEADLHD
jgi:5,10-methylenetetrahydrofolate reductase